MRGAAPPVLPSALPIERALRPAPRPTFSRRESRQRYARNLLVPGPPAQGGGPPWIPPPSALAVLLADKKTRGILGRGGKLKPLVCPQARWESPSGGEQRLRCWGDDNAPKGEYPEGVPPSGRFFGDFLIGEKVTRVQGGAPASGRRGCQPRINSRGRRGGAPSDGGRSQV